MFDTFDLSQITETIKAEIQKNTSEIVYGLWFKDMTVSKMTASEVVLSVNAEIQQRTIESKYMNLIKQILKNIYGSDAEISVSATITDDPASPSDTDFGNGENYNIFRLSRMGSSSSDSSNIVGDMFDEIPEFTIDSGVQYDRPDEATKRFRTEYTFDNFIVGGSNRLTYVACTAVSQTPASKYNPLFIHGPSGLGKTHLLYAIANDCVKRYRNSQIIYVKGEEFTNQLVESLAYKNPGRFREKYRNCDMLLIDDIQFIAGRVSTQEELFHTFNALYEAGKQIVFTSDRPPKEIQHLEDRLTSRFESGLITEIEPPDLELRIAILKRKAKDMDVKVSNDVLLYLAENVTSNIRQIEGVIKKLDAYSDLNGKGEGITIELAKNSIADILSGNEPANVTADKAMNTVSRKLNVSVDELKGRKRTKEIVFARHVAIYIIRKITDMSLITIGKIFNRDHSTVLSAVDAIENELKTNGELAVKIDEMVELIRT